VKSARKQVKARESLYAAGKNPERALLSALSGFQDFRISGNLEQLRVDF